TIANGSTGCKRLDSVLAGVSVRKSDATVHVRFALKADRLHTIIAGPLCATSGLMRLSDNPCSITSWARRKQHGGGSPFRPELGKTCYRQAINQATAQPSVLGICAPNSRPHAINLDSLFKEKNVRNRLRLALLVLGTLAIAAAAAQASAQGWPTRPVTVVVPFAAGSSTDTAARILAVGMSEALGQQLVMERGGGAAGMTGTLRVARSAPDGYQMLFGTVDTLAIAPALQKQPPYDPLKDFVPAGMVVEQPIVLIVREDLPVKTLAEF